MTYADGVSLRDYFELRFNSMDKALTLSQETLEVRLERMNEFREAMQDQSSHFVTREEMALMLQRQAAENAVKLSEICTNVENLKTYKATMEGKASQNSVVFSAVIALIGLLLAVVSLLYPSL